MIATTLFRVLFIASSAALIANAATVYSSTCWVSGSGMISGVESCLVQPGESSGVFASYAGATSAVSINLLPDAQGYSTINSFQQTKLGVPIVDTRSFSEASASAVWTDSFSTAGLARLGYLQVLATDTGRSPGDNGAGVASLDFGLTLGYTADNPSRGYGPIYCGFYSANCGNVQNALNHYNGQGGFVVQLGTLFTMTLTDTMWSYVDNSGFSGGNGEGSVNATFRFRFLEADAATPVTLEELQPTPEPSAFALLALTTALGAGARVGWSITRRMPINIP